MIWKKCVLLAKRQIGKDALGNPVNDLVEVGRSTARFTPWTDEQTALEDREVTRNEQQFLIPLPYARFPACQAVELDGHRQEITQVVDFSPRFTLIRVKCYRGRD